tara:strand:+ start:1927 stop:2391 length:465 start_codon:yes stop_codon:yes gene_type:complete
MSTELKKWFVLLTKFRREMMVCSQLSNLGIDVYLPTKIEFRLWSDRRKKVIVPLLPSMVLVSLEENNINEVFKARGVVRYLFEQGKRANVSDEEVLAMQSYLKKIYPSDSKEFKVGDMVKIPLLEQEGKLLSVKGKKCLARLNKLGALVSFQLN